MASANPNKVDELTQLLGDRYRILKRPSDLAETIEDGATLRDNSLKKAIEVSEATGSAALADDTGLFVDALDGLPGVRSARYAGDDCTDADNVAKLLDALAGITGRSAAFKTVVSIVRPGLDPVTAEGSVLGAITTISRGTNGFGYDPIFEPSEGEGSTFAEMAADQKNIISHRSRALANLVVLLSLEQ